jgi:hypothetical protein
MVDANMYCFCLSALEFGILGTWVLFKGKIWEERGLIGSLARRGLCSFIYQEISFFWTMYEKRECEESFLFGLMDRGAQS